MPEEDQQDIQKLADHLFRQEAGKMISVLTRLFGFHNTAMVEDVVQEAFAKAISDWRFRIPDNPSGWLMQVAKNKAIDIVRRQRYQNAFAAETSALLKSEYTAAPIIDNMFLDHEIQDSQLQMIFACCHPSLDAEDQIALTLKSCSGFSIAEIASGLLSNSETIKKRIQRARAFLVNNNIKLEIPTGNELKLRLEVVLQTLYVLFNEGYNSSSKEELIRKDLCYESLRLAILLTKHPLTQSPKCYAIVALMSLLTSRFEARLDENSEIVLLEDQDRSKWNKELIEIGLSYLDRAMQGDEVTEYHLQAAIVAEHSIATDFQHTNWERILGLYDLLATHSTSPVVLLNRAIVIGKIHGPNHGVQEINNIPGIDKLMESHYLFPAVMGELNRQRGHLKQAQMFFEKAERLTHSPVERKLLARKISQMKSQ